jgi:hypothetical protein
VFDVVTVTCSPSCSSFYIEDAETGVCVPISCTLRSPEQTSLLVCGPFPCFLSNGICLLNCPQGQAPSSTGICAPGGLFSPVNADLTVSLNNAVNTKLDKSVSSPVVLVSTETNLNGNADISGVTIQGLTSISNIKVITLSTLSILFQAGLSRPVIISFLNFNISLPLITSPLINATSLNAQSSVLNVSQVTFSYSTTLGVPLVILSGLNNVQLTSVSFVRVATSLLANADNKEMCEIQTNTPSLDLNNSQVVISSSSFENLNTGV